MKTRKNSILKLCKHGLFSPITHAEINDICSVLVE